MYQLVLGIQIVSIIALLAECYLVFRDGKGALHTCLLFSCATTLVNNIGYLSQLLARSGEAYLTALKLSYLGRVWISFALILFIAELTQIKISQILKRVMALINVVTYVIIYTTEYTGLYYICGDFEVVRQFPNFHHENGIWHDMWTAVVAVHIVLGLGILFVKRHQERNKIARARLLTVIIATLTEGTFTMIAMLKLFPVTRVYDVTMLGFPIGTLFVFIGIFKYKLLDTETLAREYVIDELSEGIIATNEQGEVSYFNKPALAIFPALEDNAQEVMDRLRAVVEADEPLRIEDRIYSPEKNILYQDGVEAGTLYAFADDTEHYQYMAELEEQKRIADEANQAKSSFLANMSHEIRTPINAVLGMDEMILRESREKETISYAQDIQTAGRTLLSLINDILDFSKIEEGRMEILPTQYALSSVIGDLVNMIRDRANKKGLHLEVAVDQYTPHILYGDEIRIKQIVLNLLTNAVKYTESGTVKLSVGFSKCADQEILLRFAVADTGIGMKEEDMEKLFSPFSRIEESRNRSIEGTGLGMSIVKQLLALMDSQLEVNSVYGEGSDFSFAIRQRVIRWEAIGDFGTRFETETTKHKAYHELFHAPDAQILVVDDNEVNLTVIRNLLKQTQVKVDTAFSGAEALQAAEETSYDVIFIDHMMPDMDGIETLHRLQTEIDHAPVCIALTANAVSGARELYLQAGFADYLSKPVDGRMLEEMLRHYLPAEKVVAATAEQETDPKAEAVFAQKILVVDDDAVICALAREILEGSFAVESCMEGSEALQLAKDMQPALILLDINMAGMNGFEVFQKLREDADTCDIPVLYITADEDREKEAQALKNGAQDLIRKPFAPEVLLQRCRRIIALDRYQKNLQGEVVRQTDRAERLNKEMMLALSHTVDAKDHYTNGHSERVAAYSAEIARRMGKSFEEQEKLYKMGLLHDIGKIGVSELIINKTAKLTLDEFGEIKEHTTIGYEILKGIKDMPELAVGARSHHEKYDGSGYPDGLKGEMIPEEARIICVADCYDAMTSTRTYSNPRPQATVREEILRCRGTHFDPKIADIMIAMIDEDHAYAMNERGNGRKIWKGIDRIWNIVLSADDRLQSAEEIAQAESATSAALPQWLYEIPEIDVGQGIQNCGSTESFLSVLQVFHQTARQEADEIEKLYEQEDLDDYTIKVHALKSAARIIGAAALSDQAKALELAGKREDADFIRQNTEALLNDYRRLEAHLEKLDAAAEKRPALSKGC